MPLHQWPYMVHQFPYMVHQRPYIVHQWPYMVCCYLAALTYHKTHTNNLVNQCQTLAVRWEKYYKLFIIHLAFYLPIVTIATSTIHYTLSTDWSDRSGLWYLYFMLLSDEPVLLNLFRSYKRKDDVTYDNFRVTEVLLCYYADIRYILKEQSFIP